MAIKKIIEAIIKKHKETGIEVKAPATHYEIYEFEQQIGFTLRPDFVEFIRPVTALLLMKTYLISYLLRTLDITPKTMEKTGFIFQSI